MDEIIAERAAENPEFPSALDLELVRRLIEENQEALRILAGETSQGGATRDDQQEQHAGLQIPDNPRMKRAGEPEMPGGESGVPAPAENLAREGSRPGRPVSASGGTDQANASTEDARLADSVPIPEWAIGERWLIWLCSDPECGAYTVDGSKEGCICHVDPVATVEIEVVPAADADRLRAERDRYRAALERNLRRAKALRLNLLQDVEQPDAAERVKCDLPMVGKIIEGLAAALEGSEDE